MLRKSATKTRRGSSSSQLLAARDHSGYIMESKYEVSRLEKKTDPQLAWRQLAWAGLRPGMRALEVGCGSGAVTRVMERIVVAGHAIGVDQSADRIKAARTLARKANLGVRFKLGNAYALPVGDGKFDFAWSRFLFEYLRHPERALRELIRVTKPGGIISVADLDGQLEQFYPLDRSLKRDLTEALRLLGATGFDPHLGRKLFTMFQIAGLHNIRVKAAPYQVYAGPMKSADLANWRLKSENSGRLLARLTGDTKRWMSFSERFMRVFERSDLFYHCTMIHVSARSPTRALMSRKLVFAKTADR